MIVRGRHADVSSKFRLNPFATRRAFAFLTSPNLLLFYKCTHVAPIEPGLDGAATGVDVPLVLSPPKPCDTRTEVL